MDSRSTGKPIGNGTALYGVVGHPLGHSLSPLMHNRAFEALGLDAVYLAFETRDILGVMAGARALPIQGLSVTIPHKRAVMECLDEVDPAAQKIGAVNTVARQGKRLVGFNTDAAGARRALESRLGPGALRGMRCLLVGAGGAARAVGFALLEAGASLALWNRSPQRGQRLALALGCPLLSQEEAWDFGADLLVNATPVGMVPMTGSCPVPEHALRRGMAVFDLVYNPPETLLLQKARDRGCITVSGLDMFLYQGALQLKLWTGLEPPLEAIKTVVSEALAP